MTTRIDFDFTNLFQPVIARPHGLTRAEVDKLASRVEKGHAALAKRREAGELGFYDLPFQQDLPGEMKKLAADYKWAENVVVMGIGGSALGLTTCATALRKPYHLLTEDRKLFVTDNIDPDWFDAVLKSVDLEKTVFNVISKSGTTAETMTQFVIVRDRLMRQLGAEHKKHLIVTTDAEKGVLRDMVEREGYRAFVVPDNVGGRFSVLTPVGMVGAALVGLDVAGLLRGARAMAERTESDDVWQNPAYLYSATQYLMDTKKDKPMSVLMPYSTSLKDLADWFAQLWAESLGKVRKEKGKTEHVGPTPIKTLGATDQHSQVQLYREGPFDKVFTLIGVEKFQTKLQIPKRSAKDVGVEYLGGKTMNDLMAAELQGTVVALTDADRPNMQITVEKVDAESLGALFYFFEAATAMSGELYGINAFDQPGVEAGKRAAFALMGREGYEKEAERIRKAQEGREEVVL